MQESTYKDIFQEYKFFIYDYINLLSYYHMYNLQSKMVFKDNSEMIQLLKKELDEYLDSYKKELKIYNFLLKNERKLYAEDIYGVLGDLADEYKVKHDYIEQIFENFDTAIQTELAYKFYLPRNKPSYLTDEKIEKYKIYAKGYNLDRIKEFLESESIYEEKTLEEEMKMVKQLDVEPGINMILFGVFDNGYTVIPKVKDEYSTLITIHELVHKSLILNKEKIKNDYIVYGEDIPIFYELLFQSTNDFSKMEIHQTELAKKLLSSYNNEPFDVQIEKTKRLIIT